MRAILLFVLFCLPAARALAQGLPPGDPLVATVTGADGVATIQRGHLCRPATAGTPRVVIIAHGSPPNASARPGMRPAACGAEAVQWFLRRGYAVALFARRGYGATGGTFAEGNGKCSVAEYVAAGRETARDLDSQVDALTHQPGLRHTGMVVVGQSAGGWGAVALDAQPHASVAGLVSMAGGRGGHVGDEPNHNCHPENLTAAAGQLGRGATTPMLWIYAANDSYFAPPLAAAMHAAYVAGGGRADFHAVDAFGEDGHRLFFGRGGSRIWGPLMEDYLKSVGAWDGG